MDVIPSQIEKKLFVCGGGILYIIMIRVGVGVGIGVGLRLLIRGREATLINSEENLTYRSDNLFKSVGCSKTVVFCNRGRGGLSSLCTMFHGEEPMSTE